jgi:hypothetical protein
MYREEKIPNFVLGRLEQPSHNKNLLYRHNKPNEPTKEEPLRGLEAVLNSNLKFEIKIKKCKNVALYIAVDDQPRPILSVRMVSLNVDRLREKFFFRKKGADMNFWDPDIWLPPNVTWSHFENDARFAAFRFVSLLTLFCSDHKWPWFIFSRTFCHDCFFRLVPN